MTRTGVSLCVMWWNVVFIIGCNLIIDTKGQQKPVPVQVSSVRVTPGREFTKVSVTVISPKTTDVKWTVNDGFSPKVLSPLTKITLERKNGNVTSIASIAIPRDLPFQNLQLHIVCPHSSFQVHAEFGISHTTPAKYEKIDQFSLVLPRESEIGVSSKGESRFHIFVNTTGSGFSFGMAQAEAHYVSSDSAEVNSTTAFAFPVQLPGLDAGNIQIKPMFSTNNEYHADVLIKDPALHKTGGVISISVAGTSTGSLINRLDVKQTLYIHSRPGISAVSIGSLAFLKDFTPKIVSVNERDSTILRCTSFGNPVPKIQLYERNGKHLERIDIPSFVTSLPFQTSSVFQLVNLTMANGGDYYCVASNGLKNIQTGHRINVIKV